MSAMHQDDLVLLDIDNGVAILTLNNPSARNIVKMTQASVLKQRLDQVMAMRDQIKGMVLCAAGDHFMVGGDIHYFKTELQQRDSAPEQIGALIGAFNDAVRVLDQLPFPVVGLVQGAVAGGGLSLATACDILIAADDARFVMAYSALGATPDGGGSWSLTRKVGPQIAMHMLVFNEPMDAARAFQLGLVAKVVPRQDFDKAIQDTVRQLAAASRGAMHGGKSLIRSGLQNSLDTALDNERKQFMTLIGHDDFAEGVNAFIEKRRPRFQE